MSTRSEELRRAYESRLCGTVSAYKDGDSLLDALDDLAIETAACLAELADQRQPEPATLEAAQHEAGAVVTTALKSVYAKRGWMWTLGADSDMAEAVKTDQLAAVERATKPLREELARLETDLAHARAAQVTLAEQRDANAAAARELAELRTMFHGATSVRDVVVQLISDVTSHNRLRALLHFEREGERG